MQSLPPRAEPDAALQRAQLLAFVEGFKRKLEWTPAGKRIEFRHCELRNPIERDELVIFVQYRVDKSKWAIGAIGYHLPDTCETYVDLGALCAEQCIEQLPPKKSILHHQV